MGDVMSAPRWFAGVNATAWLQVLLIDRRIVECNHMVQSRTLYDEMLLWFMIEEGPLLRFIGFGALEAVLRMLPIPRSRGRGTYGRSRWDSPDVRMTWPSSKDMAKGMSRRSRDCIC